MALSGVLGILFLLLLFADELVRIFVRKKVDSPIELPKGSQIRESNALIKLLGFGIKGGPAGAITVGKTIVVPKYLIIKGNRTPDDPPHIISEASWTHLIDHERIHIKQRIRFGRLYLPVYLLLFVWSFIWHGKSAHKHHAMEKEARHKSQETA